jgi:hypothetical protein
MKNRMKGENLCMPPPACVVNQIRRANIGKMRGIFNTVIGHETANPREVRFSSLGERCNPGGQEG